jgi:hypothetical protein
MGNFRSCLPSRHVRKRSWPFDAESRMRIAVDSVPHRVPPLLGLIECDAAHF